MKIKLIEDLKEKSRKLKREIYALYFAFKDKRVGLGARIVISIVVAYAISPIDIIPDFIPIFGYLDDLVLLPLGIMLALKLIPKDIMDEYRTKAEKETRMLKPKKIVVVIIVLIWILVAYVAGRLIYDLLTNVKT